MALIDDLKADMIKRVNRLTTATDLMELFSQLSAPLDVDILDNYFKWFRIKKVSELSEYEDNPLFYLVAENKVRFYANEVDKVRLLEVDDYWINKNFGLKLRDWMIEEIPGQGDDNGSG